MVLMLPPRQPEMSSGMPRRRPQMRAHQLAPLSPVKLLKRRMFCTPAHPFDVTGAMRALLIDIDEVGLWLKKQAWRYGKAPIAFRVHAQKVYGHGGKWTLILAIDCAGNRWVRFAKQPGTAVAIFVVCAVALTHAHRALAHRKLLSVQSEARGPLCFAGQVAASVVIAKTVLVLALADPHKGEGGFSPRTRGFPLAVLRLVGLAPKLQQ